MKRFLPLLSLLLAVIAPLLLGSASTTYAQDDTTVDINTIASSVVLIVAFEGNDPIASGSGTIVEPTGVIYTNRHVIEDADEFGILLLEDIREQPVLQYYADVTFASDVIDFAVLQIARDADGNNVDASSLNLPFVPFTKDEVAVGERIRVFGYPGLGEGYMVVTSGEVVTVQNGEINDERLPVWYWTDAEFSGGNSGGLVINEAGELVGIPTWVRAEELTAGRLGGVLPSTAIAAVLEGGEEAPLPSGGVTLTLINESDVPVCYVYISPTTEDSWGEDQLGAEEVIEPGSSREFPVEAGYYDVLMLDCDREPLDDIRQVDVTSSTELTFDGFDTSGGGSSAPDDGGEQGGGSDGDALSLTIDNASDIDLCEVYISPSTESTWGPNQIEGDTLAAGDSASFDVTPDNYDVRLVDCDGNDVADQREIDITDESVTLTYEG